MLFIDPHKMGRAAFVAAVAMLLCLPYAGAVNINVGRKHIMGGAHSKSARSSSEGTGNEYPSAAVAHVSDAERPFRIEIAGGLSNRLRVLYSYQEQTAVRGMKMVAIWPVDDSCNGRFSVRWPPRVLVHLR